jgi:hypothetical protein
MSTVVAFGAALAALGLAALGTIFLGVGFRLFFVDKDEVRKNASRSQNIRAFFAGQLSSRADPIPDMRIKEGMKYSKKHRRIIAQGGLSHEAIRRGLNSRFLK